MLFVENDVRNSSQVTELQALDARKDAVRQRLRREIVLIKITPLSGPRQQHTRPIATYSALRSIKRLKLYLRTRRMPARIFRAGRPLHAIDDRCSGHRAKAISRERNLTLTAAALHGSDRQVPSSVIDVTLTSGV